MKKPGVRKTNKANDLIELIVKMRIEEGKTRLQIFNYLRDEMGYEQSYSYSLMRDAKLLIEQRSIQNFGEDLKEDIERFEMLYQKALSSGSIRESRELLKEISKLKGHYVERLDISGKLEHVVQVIKLKGPTDGNTD